MLLRRSGRAPDDISSVVLVENLESVFEFINVINFCIRLSVLIFESH